MIFFVMHTYECHLKLDFNAEVIRYSVFQYFSCLLVQTFILSFFFWFQADLDSSKESTSQSVVEREVQSEISRLIFLLFSDDEYAWISDGTWNH